MTMTKIPFYHQMVKINRYFNNFNNKKIWNCKDCHEQIWIDHFDHENVVIFGMVGVKIGLIILP
jgi:Zn-finger protein